MSPARGPVMQLHRIVGIHSGFRLQIASEQISQNIKTAVSRKIEIDYSAIRLNLRASIDNFDKIFRSMKRSNQISELALTIKKTH